MPTAIRTKLLAERPDDTVAARIGALVTIAPWGGQPTARVWTAASLERIKAPVLMIGGEDDDVVDYRHGVRWIHGAITGSNRWLLTYEAARHNVGNNAAPANLPDFGAVESQAEPVWRGDRLNAINLHFITAFLDLTLKNDRTRAAYLMVPTVRAVDSVWPEPIGPPGSGAIAGDAQPMHWRGFQRRWAIGLRLTHQAAKASLSGHVDKGETEEQQRNKRQDDGQDCTRTDARNRAQVHAQPEGRHRQHCQHARRAGQDRQQECRDQPRRARDCSHNKTNHEPWHEARKARTWSRALTRNKQ